MKDSKPNVADADPRPVIKDAPLTRLQRRAATRHKLDRVRSVLAMDLPESERAIVLRHYKMVCQEAFHLGMKVD